MYKKNEIVKIVIRELKAGRLLYQAARTANVKPGTYWTWCKKDERINRLTKKAKEYCSRKRVYMVEDALFKNAMNGNTVAQIFFLKNQRPDKWRDRQEVEHLGKDKQIFVVYPPGHKKEDEGDNGKTRGKTKKLPSRLSIKP